MLALGTPLPDIALPDLSGTVVALHDLNVDRPLLVMFLCQHCPYVQHLERGIASLEEDYPNISMVGICSNDVIAYPDDDVPGLLAQQQRTGWTFPYLVDSEQSAAHVLQAACTPDFYLFDSTGLLVYRGAFDDARPKQPTPVTGSDIRRAIDDVTNGQTPSAPQRPSLGCGIKWKPGNEPPART
jgi:peroxiredoxin